MPLKTQTNKQTKSVKASKGESQFTDFNQVLITAKLDHFLNFNRFV